MTSHEKVSGYTDDRGEWRPENPIKYAPIFELPFKVWAFIKWMALYLYSLNIFYFLLAAGSYYYLQPELSSFKSLSLQNVAIVFLRNMALVWIIYGSWHLWFYTFKKAGRKNKYSPRWMNKNSSTFLFGNQVYDNIIWACVSAVPIWTAYEILLLWAFANELLPFVSFATHPIWFVTWFLIIPFWREAHFFVIHRILHFKPLYKKIHYLHHYNINPGPWSGLAMHPIEHLLYFSVVLIHVIVPSHPLHFIFNSQHTAFTPAPGHCGFEGKLFSRFFFGSYFHYLHHRLFEVNYGESTIPLDKWFGSFENGAMTPHEKKLLMTKPYDYEITNVVEETRDVKSFNLKPLDHSIKTYKPGQHLVLCLNDDNTNKVIRRTYTISEDEATEQYRISIKREINGQGSGIMHSKKIGDVIKAIGPMGSFHLNSESNRVPVFVAGGIGITPIYAMCKEAIKMDKTAFLVLGMQDWSLLPFKNDLLELAKQYENLQLHLFLNQEPKPSPVPPDIHNFKMHDGFISVEKITKLVNDWGVKLKHCDMYLCGPKVMMDSIKNQLVHLQSRNIFNRTNLKTEEFVKAKSGKLSEVTNQKAVNVHLDSSDKTLVWDSQFESLLDFAEHHEIPLEVGCSFGECGACETKLLSGEVQYLHKTAKKPRSGYCLPCSCIPKTEIKLQA